MFFKKTLKEVNDMIIDREYGALRRNYKYKCLIDEMDDV